MKNIKLFLPVLMLVLCASPAFADEQSHRKLAAEFMKLTNVEGFISQALTSLKNTQLQKVGDLQYSGKSPEKDKVFQDKVENYLNARLVWNNFVKGFEDVYIGYFSEEELQSLVKFYSSPVGKKILENDIDLKKKLLGSTQLQLKDFGLQLKKMETDFQDEQNKGKADR